MSSAPIEIHVIADSTGDTAARVARAAQAQFVSHPTRIIRHPRIMTSEGLHSVFDRMEAEGATHVAVFSTLVDEGLRSLLTELCEDLHVAHCDLLGPALETLEEVSGDRAERVPARPVGIDPDYFKRIAAMEFAVKNDDGQLPEKLADSDIVLVGVSRSGKTPLSMYLGYLGHRTANVPLVRGITPPPQLFEVSRWKVVGLTIDPERLSKIRGRRVKALGAGRGRDGYAELTRIYDELDEASAVLRRLGCPVIDTTALALEEAAGRVIELVDDRRRRAGAAS
ncbi:MAG TPA: pyruvate, water dikinase regulatory protein [Segeticoccus sp.]|jgi:regulator of PEP synthase PpsR (kinase-PPPase family)|nr:pyruvate, water dikinase regulatory protein [Segeticoccus sp.]